MNLLQVFIQGLRLGRVVEISRNKDASFYHLVLGETVGMLEQSRLDPVLLVVVDGLLGLLRHELIMNDVVEHGANHTILGEL